MDHFDFTNCGVIPIVSVARLLPYQRHETSSLEPLLPDLFPDADDAGSLVATSSTNVIFEVHSSLGPNPPLALTHSGICALSTYSPEVGIFRNSNRYSNATRAQFSNGYFVWSNIGVIAGHDQLAAAVLAEEFIFRI